MRSWMAILIMVWLTLVQGVFVAVNATFDYKDALTKSLIFLEAQRSGKLPPNHRPQWRGDSGLDDGKLANVDLAGGYYDAGDNVKYGLPMAFTVTTLAWSALAYHKELHATGELPHVRSAIKWGTDYFLKASSRKNRLYVQVGDPVLDHQCWVRPENMRTPRTVLKIDENDPGTEIAAETSAAMAASSIVFRHTNRTYSRRLLNKAKLLFEFAKTHKKTFDGECPFYCSYSGYNLYFEGVKDLESYKKDADSFICSVLPDSPYHQVYISPGGMINLRDGANTQYVTSTAFLFSVYSDILAKHGQKVQCGNQEFDSARLMAFAKQQIDYLLGSNPEKRSYMVGFGQNPPVQAHHRGASVPVMSTNTIVNCGTSFANWFNKDAPNPHELTGAFVGGPDRFDNFVDKRWDSSKTEPCTYVNSISVGVLAKLATPGRV
ncbi:ENDO-14-BETA-GLUCANASE [Salix viminalis]|uniref:Endoglucanase n=1 Tax=Salix viminalis TaxID=40686 RepID=A0A9Q0V722_SALVM|nr:ENDO-14-BETA-GLUCANASE [Salix viminalis]